MAEVCDLKSLHVSFACHVLLGHKLDDPYCALTTWYKNTANVLEYFESSSLNKRYRVGVSPVQKYACRQSQVACFVCFRHVLPVVDSITNLDVRQDFTKFDSSASYIHSRINVAKQSSVGSIGVCRWPRVSRLVLKFTFGVDVCPHQRV